VAFAGTRLLGTLVRVLNVSSSKSGTLYLNIVTNDFSYGLSWWNGRANNTFDPHTSHDWTSLYRAIDSPITASDRCLSLDDCMHRASGLLPPGSVVAI
tara:strand:+ start:575 stop:868 length:294 start_codon:yes stop_codon:yes gene_type:complete